MKKEKATIYDYARMCQNYHSTDCSCCPMWGKNCNLRIVKKAELDEANEIILKWIKEHPAETRQDRFLEMFPNVQTFNNGIVAVCPKHIDTTYNECKTKRTCDACRKEYWLEEVEENE